MKKTKIFRAVCLFALSSVVSSANADVVTELLSLDIGGTPYDVTFHTNSNESFNYLWDSNGDGVFGDGFFASAPTFWGDATGAVAARNAIAGALGTSVVS
ncbi:MAG: hypothetical protein JMN24_18455 [gamma proteobacterium endosymbiont of Lamellibrachia anaximandri]|nr:hypothetical protein [gamma proteobacterium endosymbiont of Lamellibrachia anaximandri]MBL3618989.1 hypothetical protein [gamma proteobacterium endosymbiont of Lamellibrachia anaximandri]